MVKVALAGNPNSGKTTLFNSLTGSTAHVGNWPGVTVDKRSGKYKKLDETIDIVDLPGIYSLSPYTPEEVVSRNYIIDEKPDVLINVVDATNLERNLYLTTQLLEIDVPIVVALNMSDVVRKNGDEIDSNKLSEKLRVPVIEISALRNENLDELMKEAYRLSKTKREGYTVINNKEIGHLINDVKIAFKGKGVDNPLFHAIKLVENDELEASMHPDLLPMVSEFKKTFQNDVFGSDFEALIADARYANITKHYSITYKTTRNITGEHKLTKSDKIDKVLTHRIWAFPIFALIMFLLFHFTFSSDLLFLHHIFGLNITSEVAINFFSGMGYVPGEALEGIPSIGVFLQNWMNWATGSLQGVVRDAMPIGTWYTSFVVDGLLGGFCSVMSFIPQIMLLFLWMAILEDSGYMARIAFILDRAFRKFGLSGRAFIPMLSGFGCSVPAIMSARTIEDEKERNRVIRLITCFSCGAKLPLWTVLANVGARMGCPGDLFVFSIYGGGLIAAVIFAIFMKLCSRSQNVSPFIMELPSYHIPQFRNVMARLWDRLKHYLLKAATLILAATIVIWFLMNFNWNLSLGMVDINDSILADLGRGLSYFFYPLGWAQGADGYKYTVCTLTGFIAKELVGTNMEMLEVIETSTLSMSSLYAFAAFNLFTIPCFAATGAAFGEQKKKEFWLTLLWWFLMSYGVSLLIFTVGLTYEAALWGGILLTFALVALVVAAAIIVAMRQKHANRRTIEA